ncbi:MAG TPA: hypothetical protein VN600_03125 [Gemmatimonadaceae bacterium]|nr:hypothetical protein [Gemmatimonadaceae bacterium]
MVLDGFRRSFDELLSRATRPEERRLVASRMKDTLVQAKLGLDELRGGLDTTRQRIAAETRELETIRRRKQLAEGIHDDETVKIAATYEQMHVERVDVLQRKLAAQEAELALAEKDVEQMSSELKAVLAGTDPRAGAGIGGDAGASPLGASADEVDGSGALNDEIDSLGRARARAEREADAARRLDELKRRMGQ